MGESLRFDYDAARDILTVEGVQYHGSLFREWGSGGLKTGEWFRIIRTSDSAFEIDTDLDAHTTEERLEAVAAIREAMMAALIPQQMACPPSSDWAKAARDQGFAIPSAHVCLGWVENAFDQAAAKLAEREAPERARAAAHCVLCGRKLKVGESCPHWGSA